MWWLSPMGILQVQLSALFDDLEAEVSMTLSAHTTYWHSTGVEFTRKLVG